jgi:hypothetical protein
MRRRRSFGNSVLKRSKSNAESPRHLDAFFTAFDLTHVTLAVREWDSALDFRWVARTLR